MKDNVKSLLEEAMELSIEQGLFFDDMDMSHEADVYLMQKGYTNFIGWDSPYCCYNSILKKLYCAFLILLLKEEKIKGSLDKVRSLSFEDALFSSGHYAREKTAYIFDLLYEVIENAYGFHTEMEHLCYEEDELSSVKKMLGKSKQAQADYGIAKEYVECSIYGEAYYCFSEHLYDKKKKRLYGIAESNHYSTFGTEGLRRRKSGEYLFYNVVPTFMASNGFYDIETELHDGWYLTLYSLLAKILISVG